MVVCKVCTMFLKVRAFTLHSRSRSEHPSPSSGAIETSELMFRVYTDPSPCLRFLSWTSSVRAGHYVCWTRAFSPRNSARSFGLAVRILKAACSRGRYSRLPKLPWPRMISDSVNKILSGARTRTRIRMLGQCECKCALKLVRTSENNWACCFMGWQRVFLFSQFLQPGSPSGPWFNKKMSSYQYRKSHCGDETILRPSYLHNGISYTGKTISLYWIRALDPGGICHRHQHWPCWRL